MYGQALIKKGWYWPCSVPGDLIDGYFGDKDIETRMKYKQVIEGIDFFIHCQKDDGYVSKIMSTHGTVNEVQGHSTPQMVRGELLLLIMLNHLQDTTKQNTVWMTITTGDMIPLTLQRHGGQSGGQIDHFFSLSLSEVNASVSHACARGVPQDPQLEFQWKLALALMKNTLNEEGKFVVDLSSATRRSMVQKIHIEHNLVMKDQHCSIWKMGN